MPDTKQRNTCAENEPINQGKLPEGWQEKPNRMRQTDLDPRWVMKNGTSHYGYKNSICIDVTHGFNRRYALTADYIHDRQMLRTFSIPRTAIISFWRTQGLAGAKFE